VTYEPESEILITVGVSEALYLAMTATLNPGDEVIIPEPCFVAYAPEVTFAGGIPVMVPTYVENAFKVTAETIAANLTPQTRAILLGYPNNPTGAVMTHEVVADIVALAEEHDLLLISDEIYDQLVYGVEHVCVPSLPGAWERTILAGRLQQGLRHDRLAHRLRLRPAATPRRHAQGAPVHDHVRANHRSGGGAGCAGKWAALRGGDARRVQPAAAAHRRRLQYAWPRLL
jgi:DNA-binding transcriptional MocR family regulator